MRNDVVFVSPLKTKFFLELLPHLKVFVAAVIFPLSFST
jgi:hypothetical protein